MKPVLTALIGLAIAAFATTASAHVVEITTSIPAGQASSEADLRAALESAIEDALKHAIGFTPTAVTLQNVRRVGDRIYLVLLIVDHDGEEMIKQLAADEANSSHEPLTEPADDDVRRL
jgi:hypothetical protein